MEKERLIILSDYGLDDAVALVYLLEHKDKFDGIDIVCVAGNCSALTSLTNAKKLLANFKGSKVGIRLIDTTAQKQVDVVLPSIHGNDSMGDLYTNTEHGVTLITYDEYKKCLPKSATVLSLGVLTITVDLIPRLKNYKLVTMAGVVDEEPNYEGMEFNQALDVDAYNESLKYDCVVATLDTCRANNFNLGNYSNSDSGLFASLVNKSIELANARHMGRCFIYDFITALYLINPQMFICANVQDKWGNTVPQLKLCDNSFVLAEYIK